MGAAVDKREAAVLTALDTNYTMVKTALTTRRAALAAAWAMTDKTARREALKAAWAAFRGTWKNGNHQLNADRKAAWKQFKLERKTCGQAAHEDGTNGEN